MLEPIADDRGAPDEPDAPDAPDERDEIQAILGRPPRGACRIALRDASGQPLVIMAEPIRRSHPEGRLIPDPDFYWLCCPKLCLDLARLEATGTIAKIETKLAEMPDGLARLHADHARYVQARRGAADHDEAYASGVVSKTDHADAMAVLDTLAGRGIAGSRRWDRVKCLHGQVAFALLHGSEMYESEGHESERYESISSDFETTRAVPYGAVPYGVVPYGVVAEILVASYGISLPTRAT